MLTCVLAATSLSLTAGPIHVVLSPSLDWKHALVYLALIVLAAASSGERGGCGAYSAATRHPHDDLDAAGAWTDLGMRKAEWCTTLTAVILTNVVALVLTWVTAYAGDTSSGLAW